MTDLVDDAVGAAYRALFDLTGRQALVVGAGGIGAEVGRGLAAFGATVIAADIDASAAQATAETCGGRSARVDVSDSSSVAALAADLGEVPDILVTTVGLNVRKPLGSYTDAEFDRVISTNLRGVFTLLRQFGPAMAAARRGSIIAFTSIRALTVEPGQGAYAATKAGLVQLIRTGAAEYGPAGVRCNAIAPGVVETELTTPIRNQPSWYDAYAAKSALGRWSSPRELVGAAVFLASDAASFVTGTVLTVDGGWTAVDGRFTPPLPT